MAKSITPTMSEGLPTSVYGKFSKAIPLASNNPFQMGNPMMSFGNIQPASAPKVNDGIYYASGNNLYGFNPGDYLNQVLNPQSAPAVNYSPQNNAQLNNAMMMSQGMQFLPQRQNVPMPSNQTSAPVFNKSGAAAHYLGKAK
jgi:hypothetical protein